MKVFTCTDHAGHYVGVASVVVATDEHTAARLLSEALVQQGLRDGDFSLQELDLGVSQAHVLCNGDY